MINSFKLEKRLISAFPFLIILSGYLWLIFSKYWVIPITNDALHYCFHSAHVFKDWLVFERFFNFYLTKIITIPFHDLLLGCSFTSLLYHVGIIIFAYLIARKLGGKVQALLAAILVSFSPFLITWATEYLAEPPCLLFGLASFYFSLLGEKTSKNHIKYFLCGLFLAASIFSKFFGIVFIIPVLANLWPNRSLKNIGFFLFGIFGIIAFIAINDGYWLHDFSYHLNPKNYFAYKDHMGNKVLEYKDLDQGLLLFSYLNLKEFIFYFIIFIAFVIQGTRFLGSKKIFDWRKNAAFWLAFSGLSTGIILTINSFRHPWMNAQPRFNYCIFIPWIIAFCSILGFVDEPKSIKTKVSISDIISGFLVVFFIIALLTTRDLSAGNSLNQPLGRFLSVSYFWVHVFAIALVLGAGNHLRSSGNRKKSLYIFLIGCFVMIWHNAFWANDMPSYKRQLHTETKNFLTNYRKLSKSAPVISYDLSMPRGDDIAKILFLSRLAGKEIIDSYLMKDFTEILKTQDVPFYILTKPDNYEHLKKKATAVNLKLIDTGHEKEITTRAFLNATDTLDPPQVISPSDDDLVNLRPTFFWTETKGAANYEIEITTDSGADVKKIYSKKSGNKIEADLPKTRLRWRVSKVKDGENGPWSSWAHFIPSGFFGCSFFKIVSSEN